MKAFFALCFALVVFGACNVQSPAFSPADNDPLYHCRDAQGHVIADATWCYPVDGTHTCCYDEATCITPDPDGMSHGCAYPNPAPDPEHVFGARRTTSRQAER